MSDNMTWDRFVADQLAGDEDLRDLHVTILGAYRTARERLETIRETIGYGPIYGEATDLVRSLGAALADVNQLRRGAGDRCDVAERTVGA